jgi:tight adherence protein B
MFEIFLAIMFVGGLALVVFGYSEVREERAQGIAMKISRRRQRAELEDTLSDHEREFAQREENRAAMQRRTALPSLSGVVAKNTLLARLDEDLFQARSTLRASELIIGSIFLGLAAFIGLYLLGFGVLAYVLAPICLFAPWIYVKFLRIRYYRTFEEQLADTLMLMANGLRAGFSFLQSMEMVSRESPPPISDEFGRVVQEISVGVPINDALQNLADRVDSMELNLMVTAVIIQREVGGGLAEILETISEVISERMTIRREIKVLTTQGRMSGLILAALPMAIGLAIHLISKASAPYEPSFVESLFYDVRGQIMLACALVLQLMGAFFIMRIVSIRV